jgi:hypothetical protein
VLWEDATESREAVIESPGTAAPEEVERVAEEDVSEPDTPALVRSGEGQAQTQRIANNE